MGRLDVDSQHLPIPRQKCCGDLGIRRNCIVSGVEVSGIPAPASRVCNFFQVIVVGDVVHSDLFLSVNIMS